jgi:hypothetical protein
MLRWMSFYTPLVTISHGTQLSYGARNVNHLLTFLIVFHLRAPWKGWGQHGHRREDCVSAGDGAWLVAGANSSVAVSARDRAGAGAGMESSTAMSARDGAKVGASMKSSATASARDGVGACTEVDTDGSLTPFNLFDWSLLFWDEWNAHLGSIFPNGLDPDSPFSKPNNKPSGLNPGYPNPTRNPNTRQHSRHS